MLCFVECHVRVFLSGGIFVVVVFVLLCLPVCRGKYFVLLKHLSATVGLAVYLALFTPVASLVFPFRAVCVCVCRVRVCRVRVLLW